MASVSPPYLSPHAKLVLSLPSPTPLSIPLTFFPSKDRRSSAPGCQLNHRSSFFVDVESVFPVLNHTWAALDHGPDSSSLVSLCSDLNWQEHVHDLRKEAIVFSKDSHNSYSSSTMAEEGSYQKEDDQVNRTWDCESAIWDLRNQASLLAAELFVEKFRNSMNWDLPVSEIHQQILGHFGRQGADWQSKGIVNTKWTKLLSMLNFIGLSTFLHGSFIMDAVASEDEAIRSVDAAASRSPAWVVPTVLAFPVVAYILFNVYRDQVNPQAKLTDWLFGVVVVVIVANLVMMATIGVRLY